MQLCVAELLAMQAKKIAGGVNPRMREREREPEGFLKSAFLCNGWKGGRVGKGEGKVGWKGR